MSRTAASRGYTGAHLHDVAVDPSDYRRVFTIGRSGLFRSDNRGDRWQGLNYPPVVEPEWNSVEIDPANPDKVIATDEAGGVIFLSQDAGRSFNVVFKHPEVDIDAPGDTLGGFSIIFDWLGVTGQEPNVDVVRQMGHNV